MADVVVLGQVGLDIVHADGQRREMLGGKGANQAVALAQLGVPVALVGVVGDDAAGREVLAQAAADGIDVTGVVVRSGGRTAVLTDEVGEGGTRRLIEDVPDDALLTPEDVAAAGDQIASAQALALQLQQPGDAVRAALDRVPAAAVVVSDGAPADERTREAVLRRADVVRADAIEAGLLVGRELDGIDDAREAAAELLTAGPRLVALAVEEGDLLAWRAGPLLGIAAGEMEADPRWADGEVVVPLLGDEPVDPTGAGDAFVAALTAALLGGSAPEDAAWVAAAAASLTVAHPGGRPDLTPGAVGEVVRRGRGA
jgi:ribokinase